MLGKLLKKKPILTGVILGFLIAFAIELTIIKIGKSGKLFIAAQYFKGIGPVLWATDWAFFGGLTGFLLTMAKDNKR